MPGKVDVEIKVITFNSSNHAHIEFFECNEVSQFLVVAVLLAFMSFKKIETLIAPRQQTMGSVCFGLRHDNWLNFRPKIVYWI